MLIFIHLCLFGTLIQIIICPQTIFEWESQSYLSSGSSLGRETVTVPVSHCHGPWSDRVHYSLGEGNHFLPLWVVLGTWSTKLLLTSVIPHFDLNCSLSEPSVLLAAPELAILA